MNVPLEQGDGLYRRKKTARSDIGQHLSNLALLPSLERRRLQCYAALMVADSVALLAAFQAVQALHHGGMWTPLPSQNFAILLLPIYLLVALYHGAYSWEALRSTPHSISGACSAFLIADLIVVFISFCQKNAESISRIDSVGGAVFALIALSFGRYGMRKFVRWRCGAGILTHLVIEDGGPDLNVRGAFSVSAQRFNLSPTLDSPEDLDRIGCFLRNADRVTVSSVPERLLQWTIILKGANVEGEVVDETVAHLSAIGARNAHGVGLLQVSSGPLGTRERIIKRLFDVAFAGGAIVLLAPLLLLVALAVKLEDGGPVFFRQKRVGRGNRFFFVTKFRSMSVNKVGVDGAQSASRNDSRITRVGRIIRATSIDELPQLFNILSGDMSVVGPRPHATGSLAGNKLFWQVDCRYWERHALKPGLTGLAQVRGFRGATDHEEDLAQRLSADLEYLRGWSIWRDIWIVISTARVLMHDKAY